MIKGWNRKGQFYLIAAIIIATVIIGLTAILNYSRIEPNIKIYDLKEEIQTESRNVFDYGLNAGYGDAQFNTLLIDFTKDYIDYQGDKNLYFVFGSRTNMTVSGYQKEDKVVSINSIQVTNRAGEFTGSVNPGGADEMTLNIDSLQYNFPVNKGRNFYFVVSQKSEGGEYIISG